MPPSIKSFPSSQMLLLDVRFPLWEHYAMHNRVYDFWREIWHSTYLELTNKGVKNSDDFFSQDEICVLLSEERIVGTASLNWFDLRLKSNVDHSYFAHYPIEVMHYFAKHRIQKVMSLGQLAVSPNWRKARFGAFASEILVSTACKRFVESDADAIISYTRNNRKINELAFRHGARCVLGGLKEHNVDVDYVAFHRHELKATSIVGIPQEVERLWRQRVHSFNNSRFLRATDFSKAA